MNRSVQLGLLFALAMGRGFAAGQRASGTAEDFFELTNLYTFHLTIAAEEWAKMETYDHFKAGAGNPPAMGRDGPAFRGPGPDGNRLPGPPGGPPMMGIEFNPGRATLEFEGKLWGSINVRFKGNSSFNVARYSIKRSLKLDFNAFDKDAEFYGLVKLNLNNNAMDPVQIREALAYDIVRKAGLPAPRTAFAKVFLTVPGRYTHEYAGLYTVVEQVDSRFLKSRFGGKQGLLLKPERIQGLPYLGEDWSAYETRLGSKTKAKPAEAARFIAFIKMLNNPDPERFGERIGEYVDVDEFLRFVAVQGILSNLDSPLMTGHNYFLHLDPRSKKLVWIPWDLNEAFGGFMPGGNGGEQFDLSIDRPYTRGFGLADRMLTLPGMRERYRGMISEILATNFTTKRLDALIDQVAAVVRPAVFEDRSVPIRQFENAISGESSSGTPPDERPFPPPRGGPGLAGGGRKPPLKLFITQRVKSIESQLAGQSEGYVPRDMGPRGGRGPRPGGPNGPPPFPPPGRAN